jgi:glycerol-3-phosphate dehydrogenase
MAKIEAHLTPKSGAWTAGVALPGGDFAVDAFETLVAGLQVAHPFLSDRWARRLVRAYGSDAERLLQGAGAAEELGRDFGATLTEVEVRWLMEHEFARRAEDVVWRRSKLGLRMTPDQVAALDDWMRAELSKDAA